MNQTSLDLQPPRRLYSVSALTHEIREILTTAYDGIWVSGEISGLKLAASGHAYFNLKDSSSQIRCVIWKGNVRLLRVKPQEGMAVLARGRACAGYAFAAALGDLGRAADRPDREINL